MYIILQHKWHRHAKEPAQFKFPAFVLAMRDRKANRVGRRILSPARQAIDCDAILHPQVSTHVLIPGPRQKIDVRELG